MVYKQKDLYLIKFIRKQIVCNKKTKQSMPWPTQNKNKGENSVLYSIITWNNSQGLNDDIRTSA